MGPEECTGELQLDGIRDRPWSIWYVLNDVMALWRSVHWYTGTLVD
jgi:hypothetical protein